MFLNRFSRYYYVGGVLILLPSGVRLRVKAGVVCLQCESCVIHTWTLQRWVSYYGALYKCLSLPTPVLVPTAPTLSAVFGRRWHLQCVYLERSGRLPRSTRQGPCGTVEHGTVQHLAQRWCNSTCRYIAAPRGRAHRRNIRRSSLRADTGRLSCDHSEPPSSELFHWRPNT